MAFSYSINSGKYSYFDKSYLLTTLGLSSAAVKGLVETPTDFMNPGIFVNEYKAIFDKTLAVTDGYNFFEDGNTQHMDYFLKGDELTYKADKNLSSSSTNRITAYKELYLEKILSAGTSDITITSGSINSNYKIDGVAVSSTLNATQKQDLYDQLEKEANLLKAELHESDLAYGGYPEIGYTSVEAKSKLLEEQLDVAMQEFLTNYDQLFSYYKIKAGAHSADDSANDTERKTREQEAATAATMNATLAINYAQDYYSQTIKPQIGDYVFGQAPIVFSTTVTGGRAGFSGTTQSKTIADILEDYSTTPASAQFKNLFLPKASFVGFDPYSISNFSINKNLDASTYDSLFWDMNQGGGLNKGDLSAGADDAGSKLTNDQLIEIGDSPDEYINWMVRDTYAVGGLTATVKNTDYCSDKATFLSNAIFESAQKIVDLKMQLLTTNIEASINNRIRAEYEARLGAMAALLCPTGTDPYTIDIDGQKYILGQDNDQNGTVNSMKEILGINDTQENIFESMKKLDKNNDGYVSQEELQANNIILTAIDKNGQLTNGGYDMSLVKGINLADLQKSSGTNNIFGTFTMDLQDKKVNGNLTFEDDAYFNKLFGWDLSTIDNIDEDSSVAPITIPVSSAAKNQSETTPEATVNESAPEAEATPSETEDTSASEIETNNFSFNFTDADDNKSTIEKLLDQICWKLGITNISSSQKYSIIDNIDPTTDASIAESEITEDLEKFNFSA